jgi:hypothetical protein
MGTQATSTFWTRTKEAFDEAGLDSTQAGVAKFLGIKQPSISDWNKPDGYPTIANAIKLANHANVSVEWLLTGRGQRRLPPKDRAAEQLWQVWKNLQPIEQGQLLGVAKGFLEGEGPAQNKRAG